jgi:hypothetical protein
MEIATVIKTGSEETDMQQFEKKRIFRLSTNKYNLISPPAPKNGDRANSGAYVGPGNI